MWPDAEVDEASLLVDADLFVGRDLADPFGLVFLADRFEEGDRLVARPYLARDLLVALDDLAHARLELRQILGGERRVTGEIVIEAGLGRRAERDLDVGIELLRRLSENMRRIVAQHLERLGHIAGDDGDPGVPLDRRGEILELAVDADHHGGLGEAGADRGGDLAAGHRSRRKWG